MANRCISCNNCGHTGWSKNRGNFLITIVLAVFFFVPAVIYEIWRRTGPGVCENCGSDLIKPSNACYTNKPSDVGDLIVLSALGIMGGVVVVIIYAFIHGLIYGGPSKEKTIKDYEGECMAQGLKYYQQQGQYPVLQNGVETSTHVLNVCRNSKDGKFKAP
jgi:TM2 domain-containing membrane protein YozV